MSAPLTVQSLIDAGVPELVNLCPADTRFYQYLNTFQERALSYGRWWGTTKLAEFCVTPDTTGCGTCIVLPPSVAVVEAVSLDGVPRAPVNQWYNFVRPHPWRSGSCGSSAASSVGCSGIDWGSTCNCGCGCGPYVSEDKLTCVSFNVTSTGQRIRFYPASSDDAGKKIIVQGYDSNNIWVRTEIDGTVQDGEEVTLAMPFVDTDTQWYLGSPAAIIKEVTDYRVLMFAVNADTTVGQQLASYQPRETHPQYRKIYLPGYRCRVGTCNGNATLRAVVSLNHSPVAAPNDWLLFQSIAAYEDGVQAVRYWREGDRRQGDAYFFGMDDVPRNGRGVLRSVKLSGALPTLQAELRKMTGDSTSVGIQRGGLNLAGFR